MLMPLAILMKKKRCLIFREIYFNSCKKEFSTIANIKFKITSGFKGKPIEVNNNIIK